MILQDENNYIATLNFYCRICSILASSCLMVPVDLEMKLFLP